MTKEITASVTERGQVTIPAEVRKALGLKKRDKVNFVIDGEQILLRRPRFTIETAYGSVKPLNPPVDWREVEQAAKDEVAERYVRKMREGNA
jgi:antitoxin PrlF